MTIRDVMLAGACATAIGCAPSPARPAPSAAEAQKILPGANDTTRKLGIEQSQASWVQQTFITDDTEAISARANQSANEAGAKFAREAGQFDAAQVSAHERRRLTL